MCWSFKVKVFGKVAKKSHPMLLSMNNLITDFAQALISEGYFDRLPEDDRLFYKNSKLRKDNKWYEKCRVAAELLKVEKQLDDLIDCYCEDRTLHSLLENKKKVWVSSIPNTKFSLVDYFFCRYLEQQHPHLEAELVKLVPVDEYHFFDFDRVHLGDATGGATDDATGGATGGAKSGVYRTNSRGSISHQNHPRPKQYIINVAEEETGVGHVFVCDESGCWR